MRSVSGLFTPVARVVARLLRHASRALLVLLCAAVPLYGAAGARLSTLGPMHEHRVPALAEHDHRSVAEAWRDLVHQGLQRLAGQASSQILETARTRQLQRQAPTAHVHAHGLFERHFHAPGDASVVLDGHDLQAMGDAAALGSHVLPAVLPGLTPLRIPSCANGRWLPAPSPAWRSTCRTRLERPPRR
ncbi:hypothetical protein [Mitsuaria sp. GD03876]|uniref:hypothetical protein n=1 Tax=Mitsuaria sp. GD03876 TaxID=2975399 RepID=UPI002449D8B4|nr:hypothetical protein [Mitsuaria sp. GD03876]MDH0863834.1 hypothetical protein [Mitsuaria sp. GD03876]